MKHPRWIVMGWAAVLGVVAFRHLPVAWASHSHTGSNQIHIATIHGNNGTSTSPGSEDEQYCVQSHTATIDGTQMANFIENTLAKTTGAKWDGAAGWRVDLWRTQKFCTQYDSATRGTIEIEYHIKDDWWEISLCQGSYSCVVGDNPVWDSAGGHTHYKWMYSYLQTEHVWDYNNRTRNFINHESGHILGLKDPDGSSTYCQDSVMHNNLYGCPSQVYYPTANDLAAVTRIADRANTW
jgi:hypothetical protein